MREAFSRATRAPCHAKALRTVLGFASPEGVVRFYPHVGASLRSCSGGAPLAVDAATVLLVWLSQDEARLAGRCAARLVSWVEANQVAVREAWKRVASPGLWPSATVPRDSASAPVCACWSVHHQGKTLLVPWQRFNGDMPTECAPDDLMASAPWHNPAQGDHHARWVQAGGVSALCLPGLAHQNVRSARLALDVHGLFSGDGKVELHMLESVQLRPSRLLLLRIFAMGRLACVVMPVPEARERVFRRDNTPLRSLLTSHLSESVPNLETVLGAQCRGEVSVYAEALADEEWKPEFSRQCAAAYANFLEASPRQRSAKTVRYLTQRQRRGGSADKNAVEKKLAIWRERLPAWSRAHAQRQPHLRRAWRPDTSVDLEQALRSALDGAVAQSRLSVEHNAKLWEL